MFISCILSHSAKLDVLNLGSEVVFLTPGPRDVMGIKEKEAFQHEEARKELLKQKSQLRGEDRGRGSEIRIKP